MPFDAHLEESQLDAYVSGVPTEELLAPVRGHLAKCKMCRKKAALKWKSVPAPEGIEGFEVGQLVRTDAYRQVFKAKHLESGTSVALEVLRAITIDSSMTERLLAPARAAEALQHPALCALLGMGYLPAGTPWLAMEWLDGIPLDGVLTRERFSRLEVMELVWAVVDPLVALHKAGLCHGHLHPTLVMASGAPRVLVLLDSTLAMPEAGASAADDMLAVGGILFEAITGKPPGNSPSLPPLEPAGLTELALGLLDPHGPSRPTAEETQQKLLQLGAHQHRSLVRPRTPLMPLAPLKRPPPPPPVPVDQFGNPLPVPSAPAPGFAPAMAPNGFSPAPAPISQSSTVTVSAPAPAPSAPAAQPPTSPGDTLPR